MNSIGSIPAGALKIAFDDEVQIVPPGLLKRSMMSMARHPDGSIFLNTQSGPLYRSGDNGRSWTALPVDIPGQAHEQVLHGLGIGCDGRLWLSHSSAADYPDGLYGQDLFVSSSADGGRSWATSPTDFTQVAPGIPNMCFHEDGNRTFVEQPDGTLMFTTTIVPAPAYREKYPPRAPTDYGGQPGDIFSDLVFRSTDGGATWGDPTQVYLALNPHESNLALDPFDPDRILLMARCQRALTEAEDADEFMARTGNPTPMIKQGVLFESADGGRTFGEAGWTNYYGHRGNVYFAPSNIVVVTHSNAHLDSALVARISLDGGRTWQHGDKGATRELLSAEKFVLVPDPPGHSFTTPTLELAPGHFLTAYGWYPDSAQQLTVNGIFWHLEEAG